MKRKKSETAEQEVKALLQQPAGKEIIRQAGKAFAGIMFGQWPVLHHVTRKGRREEVIEITGGIDRYHFGRVRLGYRLERAMKHLRDAYFALGGSASLYHMFKNPNALSREDYSTACESLREIGIPDEMLDDTVDEIMMTILAHLGTVPGRDAWALMCGLGYNAYQEYGHVFQAAA
jgi:hypothetical protein